MSENPNGGFDWAVSSPEGRGLSADRLEAMADDLFSRGTKELLVVRGDAVVLERYAGGFGPRRRHYTASLAKSLVGGMSLMLAMDDGLISPNDPACRFVPAWRDDPLKSKITIRHLASHTSGIENAELSEADRKEALARGQTLTDHHMSLPGWKGAFWRREPDPFTRARDEAPVLFEPGSALDYSNPGMAMLAYAVTAAIRSGPHRDIRALLAERVMNPIGVADDEWSIGYRQTYRVDGLDLVANWGGGEYTARAVARVGRLMLRRGNWEGRPLVRPETVDAMIAPAATFADEQTGHVPTLCWWTHHPRRYSVLPRNSYCGLGAGAQFLMVVPHLDMIVVRNGSLMGDIWGGLNDYLVKPLMDAILPSHPRSPVISRVQWDPKESIVRDAYDSDTWPVTWADDGDLYAAWADGRGFDTPPVPRKTSLGFARISGPPEDFHGTNIRSETGEDLGNGPKGRKACGVLMVDGVLYLWARNADKNGSCSQLAWSADHAKTWTWANWRFDRFGTCTFLNFGRNYAGARDEYVYVYSHDHPSAYVGADRMVLARVPRDRIAAKDAYEFLSGWNDGRQPTWSFDVGDRVAVFERPGRCCRSTVGYNAPLKRYLWWQQLTNAPWGSETRFGGGFGLYDAPEPWGPWTTVYFTEHWDVGPGETASLPTKWISPDGTRIHLVFSGDDYFSVRGATLRLSEGQT